MTVRDYMKSFPTIQYIIWKEVGLGKFSVADNPKDYGDAEVRDVRVSANSKIVIIVK